MQADASGQQLHQRLPVKPRRRVPTEQRRRVAKACNSCNVRRVKCSGDSPCASCASSGRDCVYPALIDKVSLPRSEVDDLRQKAQNYEKILQQAVLQSPGLHELLGLDSSSTSGPPSTSPSTFNRDEQGIGTASDATTSAGDQHGASAPGRMFQYGDGVGRFRGETSGLVFLDRLKDLMGGLQLSEQRQKQDPFEGTFLHQLESFICDDPPRSDTSVNPLWFPSDAVIRTGMSDLRDGLQDGCGDWPSGGIYWWGDFESLPARPSLSKLPQGNLQEFRHLAYHHIALALAYEDSPAESSHHTAADTSSGEEYFTRAVILFGNPLDIERRNINDVSTLGMMGMYLVISGRLDAAYMHVTAAMHISIILGAHRAWADERGKRVFWSIYILDRWLSCLSGRPHTISDRDVLLPLPADTPDMPPADGMRAHVLLSRLSSQIVDSTYHQTGGQTNRVELERVIQMLESWQSMLPSTLQLSAAGLSDDPACCMLHMRYNHFIVIATRPLFYIAVKKAVAKRQCFQMPHSQVYPHPGQLKHCIAAAEGNIHIASHLKTLRGNRKQNHPTGHIILYSAICLILGNLLCQDESSPEELLSRAQKVDFVITDSDECDEDCDHAGPTIGDLLRDLRSLVSRLTAPVVPYSTDADGSLLQAIKVEEPMMAQDYSQVSIDPAGPPVLYDELITWMDDNWPVYNAYMEE